MRPMHIENPILIWMIRERWKFGKICFALVVQTVLLLVVCHLLWRAKLGRFADVLFLSEAILILLVSPYLACSALNKPFGCVPSAHLLLFSPMRSLSVMEGIILGSQLYSFCFLGFTWIVLGILIPAISDISLFQVILLHLVFGIYTVVGASVGAYGWHIFRNELFATELTYLIMVILIGGVFLLSPLDRYVENLRPMIPPFLHINPLIAVCHLLKLDVFRTPYLYELTPIASYVFVYPSWYVVCGWQALIGCCCFLLTLRQGV